MPRVDRRVVVALIALRHAVETAARVLDQAVDLQRIGEALAAAEDHVFEEVRHPVRRRGLVARADADMDRDERAVQVWRFDGDEAQAILEFGAVALKGHGRVVGGAIGRPGRAAQGRSPRQWPSTAPARPGGQERAV